MIGRAFTIWKVYRVPGVFEGDKATECKTLGTMYEYAMMPPRYPMPVTVLDAVLSVPPEYFSFGSKARLLLRHSDRD